MERWKDYGNIRETKEHFVVKEIPIFAKGYADGRILRIKFLWVIILDADYGGETVREKEYNVL